MKKRILTIGGTCFVIAFFTLYFVLFFQKGILFEGSFLKRDTSVADTDYKGYAYTEPVVITVSGDINTNNKVNLIYKLGSIEKQYTVKSTNKTDLTVYEQSNLVFDGKYIPNNGWLDLYENTGEPFIDDGFTTIVFNNDSPFNKSYYKVSLNHIVKTAFKNNIQNRGNPKYFIVALVVLVFLLIDIKFPLLFFNLRHMLSVNNPEPSDFYIAIQRLSWYLMPLVIIAMLIISLIKRMY